MENYPCSDSDCTWTAHSRCPNCERWYCAPHRARHSAGCTAPQNQAPSSPRDLVSSNHSGPAPASVAEGQAASPIAVHFESGRQLVSSVMPLPPPCVDPHASNATEGIGRWLATLADPWRKDRATQAFENAVEAIFARPEFIFKNILCTVYNAFLLEVKIYEGVRVFDAPLLRLFSGRTYEDPFSKRDAEGGATHSGVIICLGCRDTSAAGFGKERAHVVVHEFTHFFCYKVFGGGYPGSNCVDEDKKKMFPAYGNKQRPAYHEFQRKTAKLNDEHANEISASLKEYGPTQQDSEFLAHLTELLYLWGEERFKSELPCCHDLLLFLFANEDWKGLTNLRQLTPR
jgi:hypothetical protein